MKAYQGLESFVHFKLLIRCNGRYLMLGRRRSFVWFRDKIVNLDEVLDRFIILKIVLVAEKNCAIYADSIKITNDRFCFTFLKQLLALIHEGIFEGHLKLEAIL